MTTKFHLFHGGAPGLKMGDMVLPPTRTGVRSQTFVASLEQGLEKVAQRLDMVYVTTDVMLARVYAGMWTAADNPSSPGGGVVYRVVVEESSLEPDEDLLSSPGVSYQTASALVVDIHYKTVVCDRAEFSATLNRVLSAHQSNVSEKTAKKQVRRAPGSTTTGSGFGTAPGFC